jgi:phospholipase C
MSRQPGSLPDPSKPAGTVNDAMPFDHIVVVMMENHSFDNLLGELPRSGQPAADGLTFDSGGKAINTNPGSAATPPEVRAFPFPSTAQGTHVSQTWNATLEQIDGGKMDGFVRSANSTQPMGYYPAGVLPFAYYTYDEHGGYYDHVPPPRAIPPDSIAPKLAPTDVRGGYDLYGPRVPAVVASPHSKPNGVTDTLHDHTSVLATIEAKWNLPALTYRDANAATVMDFLNPGQPAFMSPPVIKKPRQ